MNPLQQPASKDNFGASIKNSISVHSNTLSQLGTGLARIECSCLRERLGPRILRKKSC